MSSRSNGASQTTSLRDPGEAKQQATAIPADSGYIQLGDPDKPSSAATIPFRSLIPPPEHQRSPIAAPAWLVNRLERKNLEQPFRGFTSDGRVREDVYRYGEDEGAPVREMTEAAEELLRVLSEEERTNVWAGDVESDEFRVWSNPELYVNPVVQTAAHALLRASLSKEGYDKALGCTLTNGFLGDLVDGPRVLNKHSYNIRLFHSPQSSNPPKPSLTEPWGFTFFGHHLALNILVCSARMVISPTFLGAEPDVIDTGPHAGLCLFSDEELGGLEFMRSLPGECREKAWISRSLGPDGLGEGRWNPFDERHVGGARQDNRVVPYEGCPASLLPATNQTALLSLIRTFYTYLPPGPLSSFLARASSHLNKTYFAWIGGISDDDAYYFRIQSPVVFCEFDFHCGIFLTNTSPAKCHVHTVTRLPNGGDYGKALLTQWRKEQAAARGSVRL
ncbi:hypothetical protein CONPUDRAFT_150625 [Coniophora puteana RWD-64-598 SS2]|uniref:Uncharacterized protein n=1 Tax=Coniophora puteana (strain RWD-64-598) TaxID=741705 RepID=A0A5M3N4L4_CONPW|nr:uncharacterized protein CONPUDRAFT_150625 [Coniophora puteana RWD-64-598 SS2]EIW85851.1 hypothetical protein CONPUDRAFT_150625 [Coniophora puteana RWD-64-598 SS2]